MMEDEKLEAEIYEEGVRAGRRDFEYVRTLAEHYKQALEDIVKHLNAIGGSWGIKPTVLVIAEIALSRETTPAPEEE